MTPVPVIELQRRLTLVGAIRAGAEKPERGVGKRLEAFRLTSPRRQLIEQAAELYGGAVSPWRSPVGDEWQVYTEAPEMPVLVMPGYSLRQSYELWEGATKRTRLCDGIDEELSGGPCICNAESEDRCDLYTRLVVALPELDTVLGWRLITRGANAGHELPTMMALIEAKAKGQAFVPARLRIDERRGVKDGQVVRFVVPTIDLGVGYLALAGDAPKELPPAGYQTAPQRIPSIEQSLGAVSQPSPPRTGGRQAAPLGPEHDDFTSEPIPVDDDAPGYDRARQTLFATQPQKDKLNVLVGQLRDKGHITTEQVYAAIAGLREWVSSELVEAVGGWDGARLHWAPLREALTRPEATQLIDWLETKEKRVSGSEGGRTRESGASGPASYNEFPEGY